MTEIDTQKPAFTPVRMTLQLEGATIGAACILAFAQLGGSWLFFALLILAPDLFMLGYLVGKRVGAVCYNIAHSYLTPLALAGLSLLGEGQIGVEVALIWGAHIGLDRAIGYGLKYATDFKDTHLNRV